MDNYSNPDSNSGSDIDSLYDSDDTDDTETLDEWYSTRCGWCNEKNDVMVFCHSTNCERQVCLSCASWCKFCNCSFCREGNCFDSRNDLCFNHSFNCGCCNKYIVINQQKLQIIINNLPKSFDIRSFKNFKATCYTQHLLNICQICKRHYCDNCIGKYKTCSRCFKNNHCYLLINAAILHFYFRKSVYAILNN